MLSMPTMNTKISQNKRNESQENVIYNIDCSEIDYKLDAENEEKKSRNNLLLTNALNKFKTKILYSNQDEYRVPKALFGIFVGILLGMFIYLSLVYSFKHKRTTAVYITSSCTFLLCVGLAFSTKCRCISSLIIPNLFTQKGRVMYLSAISGLILSGPMTNIMTNFHTTADSMQCSLELVQNLSSQIQEQMYNQFESIVQTFEDIDRTIKDIGEQEKREFQQIKKQLSALEKVSLDVQDAAQTCEKTTHDIKKKCQQICDITDHDLPWSPFKMMQHGPEQTNTSRTQRYRVRRSCNPIVDCTIFSSELCGSLHSGHKAIASATEYIKNLLNMLSDFFAFDVIKVNGTIEAGTTSSNISVKQNVRDHINSTYKAIILLMTLVNRLLSLTLLLLLIQSIYYWKNYCSKDSFDNIYITRRFKRYNQQQKEFGKESVLPLKKKERRLFVDTTSIKMVALEVNQSKLSLGVTVLHMGICTVIIVFDYVLYFLLELVNQYCRNDIEINSKTDIGVTIHGNGLIALILQGMTNDLNLQSNSTFVVNLNECLPTPEEPDYRSVILFAFLYVIAFFLVFLQTYGMRLRHKLASYYYPDQEYARTVYLHQHILHQRTSFRTFLKQHVETALKKIKTLDKIDLVSILREKIPILNKICCTKTECLICETPISLKEVEQVKIESCAAVYCHECMNEIDRKCILCNSLHEM